MIRRPVRLAPTLEPCEARTLLAARFVLTGLPEVVAGGAEKFTVTAVNNNGSTDTAFSGKVHFTSSDPRVTLPKDSTLTKGVGTFTATFRTAGLQTLAATDRVHSNVTGSLAAGNATGSGYSQPADTSGGLIASSWLDSNGSDSDIYTYDNFTVGSTQKINEIDWRGGYLHGAPFGKVWNFTVTFFTSNGSEPLVNNPQLPEIYLAQYNVGGNAGETPAGTVGGTALYDYKFKLPTPFLAAAGTKYWVRIEASQSGYPDWGLATATGGDKQHFQFSTGSAHFSINGGDAAFKLLSSGRLPGVVVDPAATSRFLVSGFPTPTAAGAGGDITVTAADAFGNRTPNYRGIVHVSSTDSNAILPLESALSGGSATFGVTLRTAGTQSITANDKANPAIIGRQTGIVVNDLATHFVVTGFSSGAAAGVPGQITVTAEDASGNPVAGYLGTVHFASSDHNAILPSDARLTGGTGTFSVVFNSSGVQTLTVNDTVNKSIKGNLSPTQDAAVFTQSPSTTSGAIMKSAWYPPDGLDGDQYVYDGFSVNTTQKFNVITWRGGYTNYLSGAGKSPVFDFTIAIYASIAGGSQPDVIHAPLVQYQVGNNAGETPAGTVGGVDMYDYKFTLPAAFTATGGTKYWIQIEASQGVTPNYYWPPDWGLATATGGDGSNFRMIVGGTGGGGNLYATYSGDAAFSLRSTSNLPGITVSASALSFSPAALPAALANASYTQQITASQGVGPYNYSVTSGSLPTGLTLDSQGKISGIPTVAGAFSFTVNAIDNQNLTGNRFYTLAVNQAAKFSSTNHAAFRVGTPGTFKVAVVGFPLASLGESSTDRLPSGVTFNAAAGVLTGTPAAGSQGSYTLHFTAHNGVGGDAIQTFTLTVSQAPTITSVNHAAMVVGKLGTFTVTTSGFPKAVLTESSTDKLPGGVTFNATTGVLTGTPKAGTGGLYTLHFTAHNGVGNDATQTFTLTVNQAPTFTGASRATFTVGSAGIFTLAASGFPKAALSEISTDKLPRGVTFNPTNGVLKGTPAAGSGGVYTLHFTAHNSFGNASRNFTLTVNEAPKITSANHTTFKVGVSSKFTITTGHSYPAAPKLTETDNLPAQSGLSFHDNGNGTATISGKPAAGIAGTYVFTIKARNGVGPEATQRFTLTVG